MNSNKNEPQGLTIEIDVKTNHCVCGSQRPPDQCCGEAKLQRHTLSMPAKNYTLSDGLAISSHGQVFRKVGADLRQLIGAATLRTSQLRSSGKSKVTVASVLTGDFNLNPNSILLAYKHALIVDTNTLTTGQETHCATGIIRVEIEKMSDSELRLGYDPALLIEFKNPKYNPERIGWLLAIEAIKQSHHLSGKKVALVTDHDVNAHKALNYRRMNIASSYKVPKNIRLIYAAADRGSHALNKLMRKADLLASSGLKLLDSDIRAWTSGEKYFCESLSISKPDPRADLWAISGTESLSYSKKFSP